MALFMKIDNMDLTIPVSHWPDYAINLLATVHKSNNDRYRLFTFLFSNGFAPKLSRELTGYWEYIAPDLSHPGMRTLADLKQMEFKANKHGSYEQWQMLQATHIDLYTGNRFKVEPYVVWKNKTAAGRFHSYNIRDHDFRPDYPYIEETAGSDDEYL